MPEYNFLPQDSNSSFTELLEFDHLKELYRKQLLLSLKGHNETFIRQADLDALVIRCLVAIDQSLVARTPESQLIASFRDATNQTLENLDIYIVENSVNTNQTYTPDNPLQEPLLPHYTEEEVEDADHTESFNLLGCIKECCTSFWTPNH